jgi:hypothetical protein
MIEKDWLTTKQAAELSGYNIETIRRLLRGGKVQAEKFSFVWMISRKSLLDYVVQVKASGDPRSGPRNSPHKS